MKVQSFMKKLLDGMSGDRQVETSVVDRSKHVELFVVASYKSAVATVLFGSG